MPHFAFCITELSDDHSGIGLIVAWNRFGIDPADADDYSDGAALYSTTQLMTTGQLIFASSKSPILIPEKNCPVNPDGCRYDRDSFEERDLVIVFDCIPGSSISRPAVDIILDFYEGSSLVYSAGADGVLKAELTGPANVNLGEVGISGRLHEQAFYDELLGLSFPTATAPFGREVWVDLMTPNQTVSWF